MPSKHSSPKSSKQRLDQLLVSRGVAATAAAAGALVMAGCVYSNTRRLDKPGMLCAADIPIEIKSSKSHPWVSRGGIKLAHGLSFFPFSPQDKIGLDIGCCTGGFTDVLLTHGAKKVYAVDVGYGELDWRLRTDARVVLHERTNARFLTQEQIPEKVDVIVCDASFISLKTILPAAMQFAAQNAFLIALIKPQFEVQRGEVGEGGIITDSSLHEKVCEDIRNWLSACEGWEVAGITESPITGMEGNKEFLIGARFYDRYAARSGQ